MCIESKVMLVRVRGEVAIRRVMVLLEGEEMERGVGEESVRGIGGKLRGLGETVSWERRVRERAGKRFGARLLSASREVKGWVIVPKCGAMAY
jgi:hypothetical protein